MSDMSAEKKPPERLCPRGAKDTDFSGSDWTLPHGPAQQRRVPGTRRDGGQFTVLY